MDLNEKAAKALIAQGVALYEIRDTPGFKHFERMLRERVNQAAVMGLEDDGPDKRPVDYWRGYVAACKDAVRDVDAIIERAGELKQEIEAGGRETIGVRLGRSEGALALEDNE